MAKIIIIYNFKTVWYFNLFGKGSLLSGKFRNEQLLYLFICLMKKNANILVFLNGERNRVNLI